MAKPSFYPEWATTTQNLPNTGQTNKVRPKTSLRTIGWDYGQLLTAEEWNWQFENIYRWIKYIDEEASQNYLPKNGTKITFSGDLSGTAAFTGDSVINASITVLDNSHKHKSADISDATNLPKPDTIVKRDSNGTIEAGDIAAWATNATTDAATYFLKDFNGRLIGNISATQGAGGSLLLSNIEPISGVVTNRISITNGNGTQLTNPRSNSPQETDNTSLVRYDYLNTRLTGLDNSLTNDITALRNATATTYVRDVRLGPEYTKKIALNTAIKANSGGVLVGYFFEGDNPASDTLYMRPIQKNINGSWITVGQA